MVNCYDVLVSHILTKKHLLTRVTECVSFLARHKKLSFLNRIITWDKKFIFTTMWYKKDTGNCQVNPVKLSRRLKMTMLCICWDCRKPIYNELLSMNETINSGGTVHNSTFWRSQLKKNALEWFSIRIMPGQQVAKFEVL